MKNREIIKTHSVTLHTEDLTLRPMSDKDFDILLKWCSDSEVLYFSEEDDVQSYNLEEIQGIFGSASKSAFCFIIEYNGLPIGECWLQKMNLDYIIKKHPNLDLRRIDIVIFEKNLWNKGLGTKIIKRLVQFGFAEQKADIIYYIPMDYNKRSIHAAEKSGFTLQHKMREENCKKGEFSHIMAITKMDFSTQ